MKLHQVIARHHQQLKQSRETGRLTNIGVQFGIIEVPDNLLDGVSRPIPDNCQFCSSVGVSQPGALQPHQMT